MIRWNSGFFLALVCAGLLGCVQTRLTNPPRSAAEQLLLSTAADRAMASVDLSSLADRKVWVSTNYFEGYDALYALGTVRDVLSKAGALLVDSEYMADTIVEARSGALSIDGADSLVGIANSTVPIPFAGVVSLPEIALYKAQSQFSTAKIALLAYDRESRKHLLSTGPMIGRGRLSYYKFLGFIAFTKTDIPEKVKQKNVPPK